MNFLSKAINYIVEFNVVSSAYRMQLNFLVHFTMSFMYILKNKGPTIEPCGIPAFMYCIDDITSSNCTYCFRLER